MNELETYIRHRAGDFPLLAQFVYPQPIMPALSGPANRRPGGRSRATSSLCSLAAVCKFARRTLTDCPAAFEQH